MAVPGVGGEERGGEGEGTGRTGSSTLRGLRGISGKVPGDGPNRTVSSWPGVSIH